VLVPRRIVFVAARMEGPCKEILTEVVFHFSEYSLPPRLALSSLRADISQHNIVMRVLPLSALRPHGGIALRYISS
jgi:hypothetical protein